MDMKEWVQMWEALSEGKKVKVPPELYPRDQMIAIVRAFGSRSEVYEYFKKVMDAEPAFVEEGK